MHKVRRRIVSENKFSMEQPIIFHNALWKEGCDQKSRGYMRMLTQTWATADSTELKDACEAGVRAILHRKTESDWINHPQTIQAKAQWDAVAQALGADGNCHDGKSDMDHDCRECGGTGQLPDAARQPVGETGRIPVDMVDGELSVDSAIDRAVELFPSAHRAALRTLAACLTHHSIHRSTTPPTAVPVDERQDAAIVEAAKLAYGLLWMGTDLTGPHLAHRARVALCEALGKQACAEGINAARATHTQPAATLEEEDSLADRRRRVIESQRIRNSGRNGAMKEGES
ncbi:hypothetical protein XccvBFoX7_gp59c [Xanthomonas phage FoX7]|uniref:Uncharacterized protein n=2 Tax=Carpasinavirus XcP1 TaxID=2182344 RepID=A0A858NY58_9CAUD|nr:hypothetical protein XccvBFoX6_gp59c [Xanthomonas phage FoX6]QJB22216.1 hypothetical protein XccvBFoX7_gp59c [Xanthomonas phage FoX7]